MDAIQLLKADHKKVKELLAELAKTTTRAAKTRSELLAQIRVDLEVHTTIEEEIFYPALGLSRDTCNFDKYGCTFV